MKVSDIRVGVGDATASATAALLLSVLQDSMGRIATILFAHKLGTTLEPECKMYRLAADVFNDSAMILDCLSPAFPKTLRVVLLSFSSILRALCGVAAGSSKASLSAHFAKWGNLGELNAKDSSQETVISLLGMLTGSLVVSQVSSPLATWTCLILLLSIHLAMNHAAVRSVSLHTLNRQRANLVFSAYLADGTVMSPKKVSNQERIFERDGVLRWKGQGPIGSARVGVSLQDLLKAWAGAQSVTGSFRDPDAILSRIVEIFSDERYLLWYQHLNREVCIALKEGATAQDQMKAWAHALWLAHRLESASLATGATPDKVLGVIQQVRTDLSTRWVACMQDIKSAKWDLNNANLETTSGLRLHVGDSGERDA
ncbi:MAG: hypothetical protein OHK93_006420 [Ramalina farinacea]|uniref:DUF647-domain-containing protein n=1 Tax=Ramalina farinacea TaxID=258253 RepID=A0AA43QIJ4_9LECA|nr:hypothetical protein [Ramalina farinacea]